MAHVMVLPSVNKSSRWKSPNTRSTLVLSVERLVSCVNLVVAYFGFQESMKRQAVGIWKCAKCHKIVAGGAYVYSTVTAATVRSTVRRLRELKET